MRRPRVLEIFHTLQGSLIMTAIPHRKLAMIALASVVLLCSSVAISVGSGPTQGDRDAAPRPAKLTPYIYGARQCGACHDQRNDGKMSENEIKGLICRMVEYSEYDSQDKHKLAFKALTSQRGAGDGPVARV